MKYGQHETFHLRLNWLRKGINMIQIKPRFFYEKDAAEIIGLGKNMVQSLRFWITATGIARESKNEENKSIHQLTELGEIINTYDPYLDFSDSLSLIHFSLIDKENINERLFVWYGLFNVFSRASFTKEEVIHELGIWAAREGEKTSEKSLKRDLDCMLRLYVRDEQVKDPEDVTQSPLGKLKLLSISEESSSVFIKNNHSYKEIGTTALMYALLKYGEANETDNISLEEIEIKPNLWGRIFHLQRSEIINALEELSEHLNYPIHFQRTNRLNTIQLPGISPVEYLRYEYSRKVGEYIYE
ncbi:MULTISPECIES: DUF4007 family protein [unclassified Paenibacillus]|uniref:DUF4007 family protein n=1 Tax=unclassified Paenibacillus TaxID=185978 RepID=UPI002404E267|nr:MULTISPECIES: DUF4007 family protein [unclassified Paenibacillus]MDF9843749.1 hypothetical protein [Paenibacillus sp. PastF-2]MDF9850412.1 hypothetical protein [Paenibacillus sp. PastM-2]MDF9856885.1 hypothetical protein [Paenibacillus sp. PastF-1]MDH6482258.1 hypothetical protein [Paenibacillus sp. PastH-2]MDH6509578.1 hypothetical protein [Paenibacillus sp. PastM-3]